MVKVKKRKTFVFLMVLFLATFFLSSLVYANTNGNGGDNNAGNEGNSDNLYDDGYGWRVYMADKSGNIIIQPQDIYLSGNRTPKPGELYWVGSTKLNHGNNITMKTGYEFRDGSINLTLPKPGSNHESLAYFWERDNYFNLKLMITEIKWNHSADEIIEKMQAGEWFVVNY